ncbi:MAG: pilus assembly protein [Acidobacteriota bacterium]
MPKDLESKEGETLLPLRDFSRRPARFSRGLIDCTARAGRAFRETEAAELVEFALALPLILVMVVGLLDFANAYNVKQKLANAARAGARLGAAEGTTRDIELYPAMVPSVQAIYDDVTTYLQNAGLDISFINPTYSPCVVAPTANYPGNTQGYCWQFYSSGNYGLRIERAVQLNNVDSNGNTIYATRVTLNYPYDYSFGFNHVINLVVPSATVSPTIEISADAMMGNQSNN